MRPVSNQRPEAATPAMSTPAFLPVQRDTRAWQLQVWVSFGIAAFLCAVGLAWLPGAQLEQAFMVMGYVFCLSAAFVLAKFVRDEKVQSLALPRLATGVGGLEWAQVEPLVKQHLGDLDIPVVVYETYRAGVQADEQLG